MQSRNVRTLSGTFVSYVYRPNIIISYNSIGISHHEISYAHGAQNFKSLLLLNFSVGTLFTN